MPIMTIMVIVIIMIVLVAAYDFEVLSDTIAMTGIDVCQY